VNPLFPFGQALVLRLKSCGVPWDKMHREDQLEVLAHFHRGALVVTNDKDNYVRWKYDKKRSFKG